MSEALCEGQQLGYNQMRLPQSFLDFESGTLPPPSIYKYVPKERIKNILSENLVRFTPLVATNDPFEIRETFKRMSGPEHRDFWLEALSEAVTIESIDAMLDVFIEKNDLDINRSDIKNQIASQGIDFDEWIKSFAIAVFREQLIPLFESESFAETISNDLLKNQLCFSLSSDGENTQMWSHYSGSHSGIMVEFDTSNPFFKNSESQKSALQKVEYVDGRVDVLMNNMRAALVSKTTEWSHEKEWRIYRSIGTEDFCVSIGDDEVHLFRFPREMIRSVSLGARSTPETRAEVKKILLTYDAPPELRYIKADRVSHRLLAERIPL